MVTYAALEEVYDSSFVDTATGTAADDLVGTSLDHEYDFRTGKIAQTDYNFETPDADPGGDAATDESLDKYEFFEYPGMYDDTTDTTDSSSSDASTDSGDGEQLSTDDAPEDAYVNIHGQYDMDTTIEHDDTLP